MQLEFVTVDVFTDRRFGGNPLAVVFNGEQLTATQMQSIAGEFNLAETTFVLPPHDASHTAQVRIFTPKAELPFAGHPNVGTAFALARRGSVFGQPIGDRLVFEEAAGLVPLRVDQRRRCGRWRLAHGTPAVVARPRSFPRIDRGGLRACRR